MTTLLVLLFGCPAPDTPIPIEPLPAPPVVEPLVPPTVGGVHGPGVEVVPDADQGRPPRRMDIPQLNASIRKATGGIGWEEGGDDQFEELASTLGVPDYIENTQEDLSPGLLFQKFLDDAAGSVCQELVDRESTAPEVFLTQVGVGASLPADEVEIRLTISDALLRFHGKSIGPNDPQLEPWFFLWQSAATVTGEASDAWHTTCVALLTHPDFYLY